MIARNQVELIVTSVGEPLIKHVRVEPLAPPALQSHFRICFCRADADHGENNREKYHGLVENAFAIALAERIEHAAVPYIEPVLKGEIHQRNDDDRESQQPACVPAAFAPEAQSRLPKTCDKVLSGLLLLILRHC